VTVSGPLAGVRVVELAGMGPAPHAVMLLADMGADVVRVDRIGDVVTVEDLDRPPRDVYTRGRRSIAVDLKSDQGRAVVLELVERADILIEGFRPGVLERLGLGPEACHACNERLVIGRVTGWGQTGPYSAMAGHDVNYIALAGALHGIGSPDRPPSPPLNYVGDFGGGSMLLAFGVLCALVEAQRSGHGQVVDAAMVDGAAILGAALYGQLAQGKWSSARGTNFLDGSAPHYGTYRCADSRFISLAPLEPQFYAQLRQHLGLSDSLWDDPDDRPNWPQRKAILEELIAERTQDEWCALLDGTDVCFAPVLPIDEAHLHPHNAARGTFTEVDGVLQPAPAPRLSRTPGALGRPSPHVGQHTVEILDELGHTPEQIATLAGTGAVAAPASVPDLSVAVGARTDDHRLPTSLEALR